MRLSVGSCLAAALGSLLCLATPAHAQFVVTNSNDSGAGSLRAAIIAADASPGSTITFSLPANSTITLTTGDLPAITTSTTINGSGVPGLTLNGNNTSRGFFVYSGTVAISNIAIANTLAQGGAGGVDGGGGLGAGGGLFVATGANVTISNVAFGNNAAVGGAGGFGNTFPIGGGGGLGGNGGVSSGGGGGVGNGANGGSGVGAGSAGIVIGAAPGAAGAGAVGGANGGGGGGAGATNGGGGGVAAVGVNGGFGGGGGGSDVANGGNGGFGGGGGGGGTFSGSGGFGGGAGGGNILGFSGFGGGSTAALSNRGGAGFGGAIFVMQGGTLNIAGAVTQTGGTTTGGAGTDFFANTPLASANGQAAGNGIFLQGAGTLAFTPAAGQSVTIANTITDEVGFVNATGYTPEAGTFAGTEKWSLVKSGGGTLVLSATNTYTGGTTVTGGLINFNAAGNFGSGNITLDGGGLQWATGNITDISGRLTAIGAGGATFDTNGNNVSFATALSGGGITKAGAGTLILPTSNSYTGATNVNAGTLEVDGSIASSSLTSINSGGTLTGIGRIGATQVNGGGVFAPGAAGVPGTAMTVSGNLAFQSGAIYLVQLSPTVTTSANVTGTATLGGKVLAAFAPGSYLVRQYTILTSAGLGGTTFASLGTTNLPAGFMAGLSYTGTNVQLNLVPTLGTSGGLSANQQNVAGALNNFFAGGGTLTPNFLTIFGLSGGSLSAALTQLSGEVATAPQQATFNAMTQFLGVMTDPTIDTRGDISAVGDGRSSYADDEALAYAAKRRSPDERDAYAAMAGKAPLLAATPIERWSVWGTGFGGTQTTDGDAGVGSNRTTSRVAGGAVGADYRFSPDTLAGFALAGGGTEFSVANSGSGRSDLF